MASRPATERARTARRVLADPAGEDHRVDAAQHADVGGDVLAQPVAEHVDRPAARARCPAASASRSVAHVVAERPRRRGGPQCLLSSALTSAAPSSSLRHDVEQDRGVEVAAARAHDQALERREAHRGVDRAAAVGSRRDRAAVAEVAGDHAEAGSLARAAEQLRRAPGDEAVRGAVEAVAADAVALVERRRAGRRGRPRGGMVWWKAVSKTATCGTSGRSVARRAVARTLGGLWSGARSKQSSIARSTSSSIRTEGVKRSPPCTTRWPTASISLAVLDHARPSGSRRAQDPLDRDLVLEDLGRLLGRRARRPGPRSGRTAVPPMFSTRPLRQGAVGRRSRAERLVGLDELVLDATSCRS